MSPHALEAVTHAADDWIRKHGDSESSRAVFLRGYTDEDRADYVFDARATLAAVPDAEAAAREALELSNVVRAGFRPAAAGGSALEDAASALYRRPVVSIPSALNFGGVLMQRQDDGVRFDTDDDGAAIVSTSTDKDS